jgi:phenylacetate-coenzyme A ligase PaaK-like adenylate-forming protein
VLGRCIVLTSGGSTGRRGLFVLDRPAAAQFFGSIGRSLAARIAASGGAPPGGLLIAMVAAASPVHATGFAEPLTDGAGLPFRFVSVPATLPLPEIVARLEAVRAPGLFGFPSVLAQLGAERRAGRLRLNPVAVGCTSETLTPDLYAAITDGLGTPPSDLFGSTEGLVGVRPPGEVALTFAEDGCIVEPVDARGRPVPPGTPSAKVLVTNLENRIQPLIRYELDDVFDAVPGPGHLRAVVRGRSDDTFRYGSVAVHPHVVRAVLVRTPEVMEYQVRAAPHVEVRCVARLDRDPASGKRRLFVPLARAG